MAKEVLNEVDYATITAVGGTEFVPFVRPDGSLGKIAMSDLIAQAAGGPPAEPRPSIVQYKVHTLSAEASVTLDAAPTDGNMLLALFQRAGVGLNPATGWASFGTLTTFINTGSQAFVKSAGASESATQTLFTSNMTGVTVLLVELAGAHGFALGLQPSVFAASAGGNVSSLSLPIRSKGRGVAFGVGGRNASVPTGISGDGTFITAPSGNAGFFTFDTEVDTDYSTTLGFSGTAGSTIASVIVI